MNRVFPFLLAGVLLVGFTTSSALAQGSGGPVPGTIPPTGVPLDGGASLLVAGGVAYGLKCLRRRKS
jgi:hypothetical protein